MTKTVSPIIKSTATEQTAFSTVSRVQYQQQDDNQPSKVFERATPINDQVIVEQPLQISLCFFNAEQQRYQSKILTVTMRTPNDDQALICGFLCAEGIIQQANEVIAIEWLAPNEQNLPQNHAEVTLAKHVQVNWPQLQRDFVSYSSCGICGKSSLKSLALKVQSTIDETQHWLPNQLISGLPTLLWQQQALFQQTGGVHGAGYYANQQLLFSAEDVGRHNAVDKVIGKVCQQQAQQAQAVLILSGRISFELVQKAVMANIPVIVAVGAPSSLAIQAAQQFNITLIGFVKAQKFNVYHADWRLC